MQGMDAQSSAQLTQVVRQVLPLIPELAPGLGYTGEGHQTAYFAFQSMARMHSSLLQLDGAHAAGMGTCRRVRSSPCMSSQTIFWPAECRAAGGNAVGLVRG